MREIQARATKKRLLRKLNNTYEFHQNIVSENFKVPETPEWLLSYLFLPRHLESRTSQVSAVL